MKQTGVIRRLDELGRIVIPIEQRRLLDISVHDPVEINVEDNRIILKKYQIGCIFCGSSQALTYYREKPVCKKCLADLQG